MSFGWEAANRMVEMPRAALLILFLFISNAFSYEISMGSKTIEIPLSIAYVGELDCQHTGCNSQGISHSAAALHAAVDSIESEEKLIFFHNLTIKMHASASAVSSVPSTLSAAKDPSLIAVAGLGSDCVTEAAVLSGLNRAAVADSCSYDTAAYGAFSNTVILFSTSAKTLSNAVIAVLERYNWKSIGYVQSSDGSNPFYSSFISQLSNSLRGTFEIRTNSILSSTSSLDVVSQHVANDTLNARVFVVVDTSPGAVLLSKWLSSMSSAGLFSSSSEYAVVAFLAFDSNRKWMSAGRIPFLGGKQMTGTNVTQAQLAQTYRNLIVVSDSPPGEQASEGWASFKQEIMEGGGGCTVSKGTSNTSSCNAFPDNQTNLYWEKTARDYDLVRVLAKAGMDLLNKGLDLTDGGTLWEFMLQRKFISITGVPDYVDGNGMLVGSASLLYFSSSDGLNPVASFHVDHNDTTKYLLSEYGDGLSPSWLAGRVPPDTPECGFYNEKCLQHKDRVLIIALCGGALVLSLLAFIAALLYRRYRYERRLHSLDLLIERRDVILKRHVNLLSERSLKSIASLKASIAASQNLKDSHFLVEDFAALPPEEKRAYSMVSSTGDTSVMDSALDDERWQQINDFAVGQLDGKMFALKRIFKTDVHLTRAVRRELLELHDCSGENLIAFRGLIVHSPDVFVVNELASRGSIRDILENDLLPVEDLFLHQITRDIVAGLEYLHSSRIGCHGRLKSSNCLIDSRWMVRLSSFGLRQTRMDEAANHEGIQEAKDDLWSAPEMLREPGWLSVAPPLVVRKADIYSLAILLFEIFGRAGPWGDLPIEPKEIIERVRVYEEKNGKSPFRPHLSTLSQAHVVVRDTVAAAWAENPVDRPPISMIRKKLRPLTHRLKKTIMDSMVSMIEKYTATLEKEINERNEELAKEKEKSEQLLKMMLPSVVAESLKAGTAVLAESFDEVTVYFSDCVGFAEMATSSKPIEIVTFLNDLYTAFDEIISNYDVYKVETIADAYMCASGLPGKNGPHHAGEIASMGLALLHTIKNFSIRHRPGERVQLRIGMHSGACVAGVVGLKMPRYCLFGDTVNTASRMESNGIPLRINCSQASRDILVSLGGFTLEERGLVQMKGKGEQMTYFVVSEDSAARRERIQREKVKYPSLRNTADAADKPISF